MARMLWEGGRANRGQVNDKSRTYLGWILRRRIHPCGRRQHHSCALGAFTMSRPEELADAVNQSRDLQARFAELMLRYPRSRWFLSPLRRLLKWTEKHADAELREEGWK